ncbi:hypothetical protein Emag_006917 [Eimeria magna]
MPLRFLQLLMLLASLCYLRKNSPAAYPLSISFCVAAEPAARVPVSSSTNVDSRGDTFAGGGPPIQLEEKGASSSLHPDACNAIAACGSLGPAEEKREHDEFSSSGSNGSSSSSGSSYSSSYSSSSSSKGVEESDVVSMEFDWWQLLMLALMVLVMICGTASESLRDRAIANEKALRRIRRRYAKELAECTSRLSASTVESLVQSRIRSEERGGSVVSPQEGDDGRGIFQEERAENCFEEDGREAESSSSTETIKTSESERFEEKRMQLDSDDETEAAAAGMSMELPGNLSEGSKLLYKFDQLSQRKIGNLRRLFGRYEHQEREPDEEPAGESLRGSQG